QRSYGRARTASRHPARDHVAPRHLPAALRARLARRRALHHALRAGPAARREDRAHRQGDLRRGRGLLCLGLALFHAGCGATPDAVPDGDAAGPGLLPLDSVLLAEPDTFYVGRPTSLVVDPFDGAFYVTDPFSRRIYRFARDGSPVRSYGRPGRGPGEFNAAFDVVVVDDSTVAAPSLDPPAMSVFDRRTGELRRSFPIPSLLGGTGQAAVV